MKNILLVEDDESIVKMIVRRLKRAGYDIHTAENGEIGVEMALNLKPDLILMDMHMPVMDGHEATKILRRQGYNGLICALTASALNDDIGYPLEAGCESFISKPMGNDFEDRVRKIMEDAGNNPPEKKTSRNERRIVKVDADMREIVPVFFEVRRKDVTTIHMALEKGDYETVMLRGHSIKGAGGGYGFNAITDIGREIEEAAKTRDREKTLKLANELSDYLERVEVIYEYTNS